MDLKRRLVSCLVTVGMLFSFLPAIASADTGDINVSYITSNAQEIAHGRSAISFTSAQKEFWLSFNPTVSGYYELFSILGEDVVDPEAFFYDSDFNLLSGTVNLSNDNINFDILNNFTAGKTYYIRLNAVSTQDEGQFLIKFFPSVRDTGSETFTANSNGMVELNCTATNSRPNNPEYFHYQWYDSSNNPIDGAVTSVYTPSNAAGKTFYCRYWFYSSEYTTREFTVAAPATIATPAPEDVTPALEPTEPVSEETESLSTPTPIPTTPPIADQSANSDVASDTSDATSESGVAGFVERLYSVALGRNSDPEGKQNWIDAITQRGSTGADAARGFLYSAEFLNKDISNEDFTCILYRTFFNREPDEAGFNAWVEALNNGASKQEVIEGFINSIEWANLCLSYGIAGGGTAAPSIEAEPNEGTIGFATRLYTTCLGRDADEAGLMAWARQLANQRDTGTGAARGFFFSSEFTSQDISNGEYVIRLYRTFMGREPDQAGYDAWVGQLDSGVSREEVFDGFAQSQEFSAICASYGIMR